MTDLDVRVKKKDNGVMTLLLVFLLVACFVIGLFKAYDKGFYDGMDEICYSDLGVTAEGVYVCENLSRINNFVIDSFVIDSFDLEEIFYEGKTLQNGGGVP